MICCTLKVCSGFSSLFSLYWKSCSPVKSLANPLPRLVRNLPHAISDLTVDQFVFLLQPELDKLVKSELGVRTYSKSLLLGLA
jgi:hypothetical protein